MRWEKNGIVGYNHQMPSVVRLNDNKGLAAAVETNNSGYHISLCYSDKDEWEYLAADQEGPADSNNCVFPVWDHIWDSSLREKPSFRMNRQVNILLK